MSAAPLRFAGYAALFGRQDLGGDTIIPGAFSFVISRLMRSGGKLPLLWQHDKDRRIGWVEDLAEDDRGLRVIARIDRADHPAALALKRGAVNGISFGYRANGFTRQGAGRHLSELDVFEVSLVTQPMQPLARVHLIN